MGDQSIAASAMISTGLQDETGSKSLNSEVRFFDSNYSNMQKIYFFILIFILIALIHIILMRIGRNDRESGAMNQSERIE